MNLEFIEKYSPNCINEFYINDKVKNILIDYIKLDNINILFFGDSATGKTTISNIILKEYYEDNNEDYILSLNSIKDLGIHTIRSQLKTFCQSTPQKNIKKTVLFDDLDYIPEQIQQLLRHCINKYGYKINFIGSCSNIQKIIDSIQSNLNIIKLNLLTHHELHNILHTVLEKENINMENHEQDLLIKMTNLSVRNLLNFVYKIKLSGETNINSSFIHHICQTISHSKFDEYIISIKKNDVDKSIIIFEEIINAGYSPMDVYENFFNYLKMTTHLTDSMRFLCMNILAKYINIFYSSHEDKYELKLFTHELIKQIV